MCKYFFKLLVPFLFQIVLIEASPTICLNMIIKDESQVIIRCLESVKPLIDYWVIVDTGSTDGTQDLVKEYLKDIPGELHEKPWVDFSHNRNEALSLAKSKGDYLLIIDADEVLEVSNSFDRSTFVKDYYYIETLFAGTRYQRVQLVNNHLPWRWEGVIHEVLTCSKSQSHGFLKGVVNHPRTDGHRSRDPKKFNRDIALILEELRKNPEDRRYTFYLAQSYKDAGQYEKAIETYSKRVVMEGWDQEVFWSLLQIARLKEKQNYPLEDVIKAYNTAYEFRPFRAEPLYSLARYCRINGLYQKSYVAAKRGAFLQIPNDILFVEKWIYDYGMLMEYALAAYWANHFPESLLASKLLLADPDLPINFQKSAMSNVEWALQKHLIKTGSIFE